MATDITAMDNLMQQSVGPLRHQYRITAPFKNNIWRGELRLSGYKSNKYYEAPMRLQIPINVSAGAPGNDYDPASARARFYPKEVFATCEISSQLPKFESNIEGAINEAEQKIRDTGNIVLPWLANQHMLLDGSGRRAVIKKVTREYATGVSKLWVGPVYAQQAAPGCHDATKYLQPRMWVDVVSYTEGTTTDDSGTVVNSELRIIHKHPGSVAYVNGTEDSAYILVTPQVNESVEPGHYISLYNPDGVVDGEPQGLFAWLGNGTNSNGSDNAAFPRFGRQFYGQLNRQDTASGYDAYAGYCYNLDAGLGVTNPYAEVTLTSTVMENFFERLQAGIPMALGDNGIEMIVTHWKIRQAYAMAYEAGHTPVFQTNISKPDLGYGSVFYTRPNDGKAIPVIGMSDDSGWPRQLLVALSWRGVAQADVGKPEWVPADNGPVGHYWRDMRNITKQKLLRAVWNHTTFFVNHYPRATGAIFFCRENPTFA